MFIKACVRVGRPQRAVPGKKECKGDKGDEGEPVGARKEEEEGTTEIKEKEKKKEIAACDFQGVGVALASSLVSSRLGSSRLGLFSGCLICLISRNDFLACASVLCVSSPPTTRSEACMHARTHARTHALLASTYFLGRVRTRAPSHTKQQSRKLKQPFGLGLS